MFTSMEEMGTPVEWAEQRNLPHTKRPNLRNVTPACAISRFAHATTMTLDVIDLDFLPLKMTHAEICGTNCSSLTLLNCDSFWPSAPRIRSFSVDLSTSAALIPTSRQHSRLHKRQKNHNSTPILEYFSHRVRATERTSNLGKNCHKHLE